MILLSADVSALIDLFKQCGEMLAGVGFVCAGLAVIKKIITNHEKMKEAIITYIVALVIFILIWSLNRIKRITSQRYSGARILNRYTFSESCLIGKK